MDDLKMTYLEHLGELRRRLIISLSAVGVATLICYFFADRLFLFLIKPLIQAIPGGHPRLIFTSLPEAFVAYMKVSLVAGLFLASPVVLYQVWQFVAPGLYVHERRYALPFVFFSSFFFIAGGIFCFTEMFPWGFRYFLSFSNDYIEAMPKMSEYISFSLQFLLVFGLIFQLPVVMYFLAKIGLASGAFLTQNRKYAILVIFVVAAVLTPPDVISQFMLAIPLLLLYELSVIITKAVDRNRSKKRQQSADEASRQTA